MSLLDNTYKDSSPCLRIGTRNSTLALWQTKEFIRLLKVNNDSLKIRICKITTKGDLYQSGPLSDIGGKGLFAKELDYALIKKDIDCAVHSLKDIETELMPGIRIAAVIERSDPRDALIGLTLEELSERKGNVIATCSIRRAAQILFLRPDVKIVPIRGNIETRLSKLDSGLANATLLSYAGLLRLDLSQRVDEIIDIKHMVPAVGQGVIAITVRENCHLWDNIFAQINCRKTEICITCERSMLSVVDGNCHTPIAGYASLKQGCLTLHAIVLTPDGTKILRQQMSTNIDTTNLYRYSNSDIITAQNLGKHMGEHFRIHAKDILCICRAHE